MGNIMQHPMMQIGQFVFPIHDCRDVEPCNVVKNENDKRNQFRTKK